MATKWEIKLEFVVKWRSFNENANIYKYIMRSFQVDFHIIIFFLWDATVIYEHETQSHTEHGQVQ